jgi:hypothetical protein
MLESWSYYCGITVELGVILECEDTLVILELLLNWGIVGLLWSYCWNFGVTFIILESLFNIFCGVIVELRIYFHHYGFNIGILVLLWIVSYFLRFGFTFLLGNYWWNCVSVGISYFRYFEITIGIWKLFSSFWIIVELGSYFHYCGFTVVELL